MRFIKALCVALVPGVLVAGMDALEAAGSPSVQTCVKYAEVDFESAVGADRDARYLAIYTETYKVESKVPGIIKVLVDRDLRHCRETLPDLFTAALSPKCHELPWRYPASGDDYAFAQCWQQVDERPDCFVYSDHYHSGDTLRMSGEWECRGRMMERGTATIEDGEGNVYEGPVVDGKREGRWVERYANGDVYEGPYVDGKWEGRWVERYADGDVYEGPYVDGKREGHWVIRHADGTVAEGPYVDDKWKGHWVIRYANGMIREGPYVDDKQEGRWILRGPDEEASYICYVSGAVVDCN